MTVIMDIYYAIKVPTSLNIYLVKPNMCLLHTIYGSVNLIQPTNHCYLSQVNYGTYYYFVLVMLLTLLRVILKVDSEVYSIWALTVVLPMPSANKPN